MYLFPTSLYDVLCVELKKLNESSRRQNDVFSIRDWSDSLGWGGPEHRGGGSSDFEPLVRGGSCSFQLPPGEISLEKESIQAFSDKYAVDARHASPCVP